jgi:myo-inositol-1(or 4)-monophosphatase
MTELDALLELAKSAVVGAAKRLLDHRDRNDLNYVHSRDCQREIKAIADTIMEKEILRTLASAELPILSEECGYIGSPRHSQFWFIVDPLDGTFNFVKGLGPSVISIALWEDQSPVFGVIYSLQGRQLTWGGPGIGAFEGGRRVMVSETSDQSRASICTGFPARMDMESQFGMQQFWRTVRPYAKVRMLGSAAASLLHVANGSADVYSEKSIMLWDVAAGMAIVQGAGGECLKKQVASQEWTYEVFASNPALLSCYQEEDGPH